MIAPFSHRLLTSALRRFFKLLYHQFSWSYDFVAATVSGGRWIEWILSVLPYLKGPRILELGHGPGYLLAEARARGLSVVGLDESWWMNVLALRKVVGFSGGAFVVNGYAQFLPFLEASFNQIVSTFPPEFILDCRTLSEVHRVLVDGGELIILPSAWITGTGWYDLLAAWLFHVTGQASDWNENFTNPITEAGFQVNIEIKERKSDQLLIIIAKKTT